MLSIIRNPLHMYRVARQLHSWRIPIVPRFITYFIRFFWAAYIPHTAEIGEGTMLGYGGLGVVIHGRAVIGKNCLIGQHVTIGGTSQKYDVPILGDNVFVGAGAKILGPVRIGNDVVVGANAVVLTHLPDNSLAVGIPAKVIKTGIKMVDYV